jgi:hypothetical protein
MPDVVNDIIGSGNAPVQLPPNMREARQFAYYASVAFLVFALIWGLLGLWEILRGLFWASWLWGGIFFMIYIISAIFYFVFALISIICAKKIKQRIITPIDQYRFDEAKNNTVIWIILGFIFGGVIPGILLVLAYIKFDEQLMVAPQQVFCPNCRTPARYVPQYQRYYCDRCQQYVPPPQTAPYQQQGPPPSYPQQQPAYSQPPPQQQPAYPQEQQPPY